MTAYVPGRDTEPRPELAEVIKALREGAVATYRRQNGDLSWRTLEALADALEAGDLLLMTANLRPRVIIEEHGYEIDRWWTWRVETHRGYSEGRAISFGSATRQAHRALTKPHKVAWYPKDVAS